MQRLLTKLTAFAVLAAAITIAPSVSPALAQGGYGKPAADCTSPAMKNDPACLVAKKNAHKGKPAGGAVVTTPNTQTTIQMTTPNTQNNTQTTTKTTQGSTSITIGSDGFFNFTPRQHDEFRQRFQGFNFGFVFPAPTFSIFLGTAVPHYYYPRLHRVPYAIWRYYPQFRGYLFFVTRRGDIVIVSPRSYRIVAIL